MAVLQPPPYQSAQGSVQWNAWYLQINDLLSGVSQSLDAIDDVTLTGVEDGDFLVANAETIFTNRTTAQTVEVLGFDTDDAVVFDTLDVETLTAEDTEATTGLYTSNLDVEGTLTGPTTLGASDAEFTTLAVSGTLDAEEGVEATSTSGPCVDLIGTAPWLEFTDTTASAHAFRIFSNSDVLNIEVDTAGAETFGVEVFAIDSAEVRVALPLDIEGNATIVGTLTVEGSTVDAAETTDEHVMTFNAGTETWEGQAAAAGGGGEAPTGAIMMWPTSSAPTGWLECDGSTVSRTTYSDLFSVLGETYGDGDESTTFEIPDLRGEFVRGWDNSAGNDPDSASRTDRGDGTTGDNVGTKQADEFKSHTHSGGTGFGANAGGETLAHTGGGGSNIGSTGGNETRGRNVYLMYIIKT